MLILKTKLVLLSPVMKLAIMFHFMAILWDGISKEFWDIFLCTWKKAIDLINLLVLAAKISHWNITSTGKFSIKNAYEMLSTRNSDEDSRDLFDKVWKWKGRAKIRITLCKIVYGRLLTNEERVKRCMASHSEWCRWMKTPKLVSRIWDIVKIPRSFSIHGYKIRTLE